MHPLIEYPPTVPPWKTGELAERRLLAEIAAAIPAPHPPRPPVVAVVLRRIVWWCTLVNHPDSTSKINDVRTSDPRGLVDRGSLAAIPAPNDQACATRLAQSGAVDQRDRPSQNAANQVYAAAEVCAPW